MTKKKAADRSRAEQEITNQLKSIGGLQQELQDAVRYDVQLDEIYLFPKSEHDELICETAKEWTLPESTVWEDFQKRQRIGEWLRTFWARMLEPTALQFDEVTPIIARVRHGCATDREFDWLGLRLALAVQMDEHKFLKLAVKLATKPLKIKAPHLISIAAFDYFDDHREVPSFTQLRKYVEHAMGEKAEKYELLTNENWTRHLRRSGVSLLSPESP